MWKIFQRSEAFLLVRKDGEDPNPTIFDWRRNRRGWIHLFAFLVFSVIIHGSGFYLFQVVYPSPTREKPRADLISLMDPADPGVRSVLQRVGDRMTFLLPPSEASDVQVSIEELAVRFTPSFLMTEMSPAEPVFPWTMPPSGTAFRESLSENEGAVYSPLVISAQGELLHREVAPWSILEEYLSLADFIPAIRLELRVDEEGRVLVGAVESELDVGAREEIKQVVESTLRYLPAPEASSGWLTIRTKG